MFDIEQCSSAFLRHREREKFIGTGREKNL